MPHRMCFKLCGTAVLVQRHVSYNFMTIFIDHMKVVVQFQNGLGNVFDVFLNFANVLLLLSFFSNYCAKLKQ